MQYVRDVCGKKATKSNSTTRHTQRKKKPICIYIISTPNLGFEIAVRGQEREQGRFRGSREGARGSIEGAGGST